MKTTASILMLGCLLGPAAALAVAQAGGAAAPTTFTIAPNIPGVVAGGTRVELVREGLQGTGQVIAAPDGAIVLTENEANKLLLVDKNGTWSTIAEETNRTVGLAYDPQGRLIGTVTRKPRLEVFAPTRYVLVDSFEGQPLSRPNDLVVDTKGGVYFTDYIPLPDQAFAPPPSGRRDALFYITPGGQLIKITEYVENPNGIQLSPDGKVLYAANGDVISAFDVQPDGTVRNPRTFTTLAGVTRTATGFAGAADGLAVDDAGRLYVAAAMGVQVFDPTGAHLGTIPFPRGPQGLAFAGPDKKTLFVVGRGALYRVSMLAQGMTGRVK